MVKIIKKYKKVFIGVSVVAAIIAIIPICAVYIFSGFSIGIEKGDSQEVVAEKISSYFEGSKFTEDIINARRKKSSGDFNVYAVNLNSEKFKEIENKMGIMVPQIVELNRLENGKNYNIKIYSDFYEGENKVSTEELLSKDIVGSENFHIIYGDTFMEGGSRRDTTLHFIENEKVIETLKYYIPTNYNESGCVQDADFNINEDITLMSFTRGIKVDGKYKTYSPALHKSKEEIEKSIQKQAGKNEKMVILRLEVNKIIL